MSVVMAGEACKGAILEDNTILNGAFSSVFCASLISCSRFGMAGRQAAAYLLAWAGQQEHMRVYLQWLDVFLVHIGLDSCIS